MERPQLASVAHPDTALKAGPDYVFTENQRSTWISAQSLPGLVITGNNVYSALHCNRTGRAPEHPLKSIRKVVRMIKGLPKKAVTLRPKHASHAFVRF